MSTKALVIGGSAAAVAVVSYVSMAEAPGIYTPGPLLFFIPATLVEQVAPLGHYGLRWIPLLAAGAFLAAGIPIIRAKPWALTSTRLAVASCTLLSAIFFAFFWRDGLEFQGLPYTAILLAANACAALALAVGSLRLRRPPRFWSHWLLHFGTFLWLSWFAFPWLGEMP